MQGLDFAITGARPADGSVTPALRFACQVTAPPDVAVHAAVVNCQIRIEPERRTYDDGEVNRLLDLFGERERWADTLKAFPWTQVTFSVHRFDGETDVEIDVPCSYDLEVAAGKYLHALRDGEIPLVFLFSGTVFLRGDGPGLTVQQIPWDREDDFRLPVATWWELVDEHWPGTSWLQLSRETIDRLQAYKSAQALPTWDSTVETLLQGAEVRRDG